MARSGRSHPNRPIVSRHPANWDQPVSLGVFETISEWPPLTVDTPNAGIYLGVFESLSEWPPPGFVREQRFTLGVFETISEWPPLTVSVPIQPGDKLTGPAGQVEWNGTLWGPGTSVRVLEPVEGWLATPQVDNLNVERPTRHGAWPGRKLAGQRLVTIRLQPNSADPTQVDTVIDQIQAATGITDTEQFLVVKGYGAPTFALGAIIDRVPPMDSAYGAGIPTVTLVVACADPRRYALERQGVTVPLGVATTLTNSGNTAAHPVIRLNGPLTNPTLTNSTLGRSIMFTVTVAAGQRLDIVTDAGTVAIGSTSYMSTLSGASVPVQDFVLAPGPNLITYTAMSGGGEGADWLWYHAVL